MDVPLFPSQEKSRKTPFPENVVEFSGKCVFRLSFFPVNSGTSSGITGAFQAKDN